MNERIMTPAVSPEMRISRVPGLISADIDGETVLMNIERGSYFGLAATAKDIWARLETETTVRELCVNLAAAYEGDAAAVETDTLAFLGKMAEAGLVKLDRPQSLTITQF